MCWSCLLARQKVSWRHRSCLYYPLFIKYVLRQSVLDKHLMALIVWNLIIEDVLQFTVYETAGMVCSFQYNRSLTHQPSVLGRLLLFSRSVVSDSLRPHGLQHARPPCPSLTPEVYSNSHPLSQWCHLTISSSVIPFSCLQSFPASGSIPMSQFFTSGSQIIGVSASASVLPMSIQDWFPLGWTGWIFSQSKGLSRVFCNTTVQKHQFFGAQLSLWSNSHIHTRLLEKPQLWLDGPLLAK